LHWACDYGNEDIVHLLVENGADVNANAYTWTAILLAAKAMYMKIVCFLLQNGADFNAEDYHGRTTLHWAARYGDETVVKTLVESGANINAMDRWGRTPMIWAVENMEEAVVELLLETGADVETKAGHKCTSLHIAAFLGWETVVRQLLDKGADPAAEVQWCIAEDSQEYGHDMAEMAERPMSGLLYLWYLEQGTGLTARELAINSGNAAVQKLLG
jgi:ankyrin repeat protein